ncbi:hypothetical protein HQ576_13855 [bacterium]|nr:hypothetical protein [bacterium]
MQQVKLFKNVENQMTELEAQVNEWIRETGAKVISISGNIAPQSGGGGGGEGKGKGIGLTQSQFAASDILLIVVYETQD